MSWIGEGGELEANSAEMLVERCVVRFSSVVIKLVEVRADLSGDHPGGVETVAASDHVRPIVGEFGEGFEPCRSPRMNEMALKNWGRPAVFDAVVKGDPGEAMQQQIAKGVDGIHAMDPEVGLEEGAADGVSRANPCQLLSGGCGDCEVSSAGLSADETIERRLGGRGFVKPHFQSLAA